jgi:hypothetical protein
MGYIVEIGLNCFFVKYDPKVMEYWFLLGNLNCDYSRFMISLKSTLQAKVGYM